MKLVMVIVTLFLCSCAPMVQTDFSGLQGKAVLVYFDTPAQIQEICTKTLGLPGSLACSSMAVSPANRVEMNRAWVASGAEFECVVFVPNTNAALLDHELTLCGTQAKGYWHKRELK